MAFISFYRIGVKNYMKSNDLLDFLRIEKDTGRVAFKCF